MENLYRENKSVEKINIENISLLIDLYAREREMLFMKCRYLEMTMEHNLLIRKANKYKIKHMFIYGESYIGIQLYRGLSNVIDIPAIIGMRKDLPFRVDGLKVIDEIELKKIYTNEFIVVSTLENYYEIRARLKKFIPKEKILFLGEFLT